MKRRKRKSYGYVFVVPSSHRMMSSSLHLYLCGQTLFLKRAVFVPNQLIVFELYEVEDGSGTDRSFPLPLTSFSNFLYITPFCGAFFSAIRRQNVALKCSL